MFSVERLLVNHLFFVFCSPPVVKCKNEMQCNILTEKCA